MKLSIVHYQPIEWYPPVMNMLNYLGENYSGKITVYSHTDYRRAEAFEYPGIKIVRKPYPAGYGFVRRLLSYIRFTVGVFFSIHKDNPARVLYYETNSSLPVYLYYRFKVTNRSKLFIHYHEYNTPEQYKEGMRLVYFSYKRERKYLWNKAEWISHTNEHRVNFFQADYPKLTNVRVLPNYPPKKWQEQASKNARFPTPLKIVYVGSLGMDHFYLKDFSEWVVAQNGNVMFDIFSHNCTEEAIDYIAQLNSEYITLNLDGVWYYDLPQVLKKYHVGLILYKGFNKNFIFNETNKLFEYLSLGLDVWFSEETRAIHKHVTHDTYPKVVQLSFENLEGYSLEKLISHEGLSYKPSGFFCESVYEEFLHTLERK